MEKNHTQSNNVVFSIFQKDTQDYPHQQQKEVILFLKTLTILLQPEKLNNAYLYTGPDRSRQVQTCQDRSIKVQLQTGPEAAVSLHHSLNYYENQDCSKKRRKIEKKTSL